MEEKGLVSVIIPTFNRANLIGRAIESVLAQSYQKIELIIVDDLSQDNTSEVVNYYVNKDKRIIYIKNKKNSGAAHSRNVGIQMSRGEFLAFLDDDCEYLPEKIREEIDLMRKIQPQPSIIYSNMWIEKENAEALCSLTKRSKLLDIKDIFKCKYHFLEPSSWFCRSEIIKKYGGFDTTFRNYDDIELLTRLILEGERIYFFNKCLSIKHNIKGVSDISPRQIESKEKFLNKHFQKIKKYKKYLSRFYYRLGKDLLKLNDFVKARNYFLKAFFTYPFQIEYLFKSIYAEFKAINKKVLLSTSEESEKNETFNNHTCL